MQNGSLRAVAGTVIPMNLMRRREPHGKPLHLVNKKAKEPAGPIGQDGKRVWVAEAVCFTGRPEPTTTPSTASCPRQPGSASTSGNATPPRPRGSRSTTPPTGSQPYSSGSVTPVLSSTGSTTRPSTPPAPSSCSTTTGRPCAWTTTCTSVATNWTSWPRAPAGEPDARHLASTRLATAVLAPGSPTSTARAGPWRCPYGSYQTSGDLSTRRTRLNPPLTPRPSPAPESPRTPRGASSGRCGPVGW